MVRKKWFSSHQYLIILYSFFFSVVSLFGVQQFYWTLPIEREVSLFGLIAINYFVFSSKRDIINPLKWCVNGTLKPQKFIFMHLSYSLPFITYVYKMANLECGFNKVNSSSFFHSYLKWDSIENREQRNLLRKKVLLSILSSIE